VSEARSGDTRSGGCVATGTSVVVAAGSTPACSTATSGCSLGFAWEGQHGG